MLQSIHYSRSATSYSVDPHRHLWVEATRALVKARQTAALWAARSRQRKALAALEDHILLDIGISREEAARESCVPFWR
jgi:uncharacterized protein YjiS (DUF1127 family)